MLAVAAVLQTHRLKQAPSPPLKKRTTTTSIFLKRYQLSSTKIINYQVLTLIFASTDLSITTSMTLSLQKTMAKMTNSTDNTEAREPDAQERVVKIRFWTKNKQM